MWIAHVASVLSDGLLHMILRSQDTWTLWLLVLLDSMALTNLGALDMVFGGRPCDFTQDVVCFMQDIAHVMQSIGPLDDLAPFDTSSHTSWTLDDGQMSFYFADIVMLAHRWERSPHLGRCTPEVIRHWMEDVALTHDWTPCKDEMHLHSTLDACLFTLDVEHMDDDVMDWGLLTIGALLWWVGIFDDEIWALMRRGLLSLSL
jgi:hypothetical protein